MKRTKQMRGDIELSAKKHIQFFKLSEKHTRDVKFRNEYA